MYIAIRSTNAVDFTLYKKLDYYLPLTNPIGCSTIGLAI